MYPENPHAQPPPRAGSSGCLIWIDLRLPAAHRQIRGEPRGRKRISFSSPQYKPGPWQLHTLSPLPEPQTLSSAAVSSCKAKKPTDSEAWLKTCQPVPRGSARAPAPGERRQPLHRGLGLREGMERSREGSIDPLAVLSRFHRVFLKPLWTRVPAGLTHPLEERKT